MIMSNRPSARWLILAVLAAAGSIRPAGAQASATTPAPEAKKPWYESVTFKGFIQLDAIFPEGGSTQGSNSNFRVRRARPTFVVQVDPLTRVQLQMDLSTGRAGTGTSNVTITDTFAERRIVNFADVQFGNMLLPFGHEIHEDNAALRSPLEMSFPAEQIALGERELGVFLRTFAEEQSDFHWELGMTNGQGNRSADANANKTLVGRVVTRPLPKLRLGVSGILGSYRAAGRDWDRHVLGIEARNTFSKALNVEGEFYNVRFVDSPAAPTKQARYNGGYVLAETWIGPLKSIPFVRYQRTYGDLDYRSFDLGWRYQYSPTQRVTLEYDIVKKPYGDLFGARWQIAF